MNIFHVTFDFDFWKALLREYVSESLFSFIFRTPSRMPIIIFSSTYLAFVSCKKTQIVAEIFPVILFD